MTIVFHDLESISVTLSRRQELQNQIKFYDNYMF